MKWKLRAGNILDEKVDVLICSANVSLNLSGGVGAELLGRFGIKMQQHLHKQLQGRSPRSANRGEIFQYSSEDIPYKAILHAVCVNGWYESTPEVVTNLVKDCLRLAQSFSARTVALTVLATGFGNLTLDQFAAGIRPLFKVDFPPIDEIRICLYENYRIAELANHLPDAELE